MIFFPPSSPVFFGQCILYLGFGVLLYYLESTGKFNLPYSKFASKQGISPKIGMFFIYFIPILGYLSTQRDISTLSPYHLLLLLVFLVHFGKRCLEVLFLHEFSGKIGLLGVILITFAYTNIGLIMGSNHYQMTQLSEIPLGSFQTIIGIIIFAMGQMGNLYHHILLKRLRSSSSEKKYFLPTGGMFDSLVCPHYLFELISWLGMAILSTHWESYVVFFIMTCYLAGRSTRTRAWYTEKFADYPTKRKRIVPFVF